METGDIVQLIILLILLALSAFFSSAETALTTVNKVRLKSLEEQGNKQAKISDKDMEELAKRVIGKIQNMTDEEFLQVVLEAAE
mgnify:CR=1 FL=1